MAKDNDNTVYAFSDGSALGNPGPGGYGVVLKYGDNLKELSQGYVHTTNNRMELMGAIMALESLKKRQRVVLTTDSQYVINGIEKGWARKWRANGWMRNRKERALNPDMWERLLKAVDRHDVRFKWVRGHMGHPENERCDELANGAARGGDLIVDEQFVEAGG
ncbi:ribonuclease HI [SAR202 cluster bacterium AD-812-D07_MRT_10900m]|jgi:ribonuclease HI|nr:ribonuclease HI [SAR202 cluster bacterium AD-812-D07_MRT_10900m]